MGAHAPRSAADQPVRIGGTDPVYPPRARRRGIEGQVEVELTVDETGAVQGVRILDAQPAGIFDAAVRRAVSGWRFRVSGGGPWRLRETIRFRIEPG